MIMAKDFYHASYFYTIFPYIICVLHDVYSHEKLFADL